MKTKWLDDAKCSVKRNVSWLVFHVIKKNLTLQTVDKTFQHKVKFAGTDRLFKRDYPENNATDRH